MYTLRRKENSVPFIIHKYFVLIFRMRIQSIDFKSIFDLPKYF